MHTFEPEREAQGKLIRLARAWCDATGNILSAAGRQAVGDSRFFTNLVERHEAGYRQEGDRQGSITYRVYCETIAWFHDPANWPDGVPPNLERHDYSHSTRMQNEPHSRIEKQAERPDRSQEAAQGEGPKGGSATLLAKLRGR
jgi:hypothetical protein